MTMAQQTPTFQHALIRSVRSSAKRVSIVGQKALLQADVLFLQQKVKARKQQFGVDLYDALADQADLDPMFLIDGSALHQIRGIFVTCYKNNRALLLKKARAEKELEQVEETRKAVNSRHGNTLSFEVPADSIGERILNAPKLARLKGAEAKWKAAITAYERDMTTHKQNFGVECYEFLLELETHWIPTDHEVRYHCNEVRRDVAHCELIMEEKLEDKDVLDMDMEMTK